MHDSFRHCRVCASDTEPAAEIWFLETHGLEFPTGQLGRSESDQADPCDTNGHPRQSLIEQQRLQLLQTENQLRIQGVEDRSHVEFGILGAEFRWFTICHENWLNFGEVRCRKGSPEWGKNLNLPGY